MLALAVALDRIEAQSQAVDEWGAWPDDDKQDPVTVRRRAMEIEQTGEDTAEVRLRAPSEEKKQQRRLFEQQTLKLKEALGDGEDWTEAYAAGGPLWLYIGNRDLVMSYPEPARAAMVQDVLEDSPADAAEMGRDVLKAGFDETGPGRTLPIADEL
jgi:hypothetical protein